MNTKRYVGSVLAVFILLSLFDWLYHGHLLKNLYLSTQQYWRPEDQMRPLLRWTHLAHFLFSLLFCYIYTKGHEGEEASLGQGFRYGFLIGLLLHLPMALSHYVYMPYPATIHRAWLFGGVLELTLAGILVGAIYQKRIYTLN